MELDEVVVPAENMLGNENQGFEIIMSSMPLCQTHSVEPQLSNCP